MANPQTQKNCQNPLHSNDLQFEWHSSQHLFALQRTYFIVRVACLAMPLVELARTVRFCVNPRPADGSVRDQRSPNTFAGSPAMHGLGAFYEIVVRCRGNPDADTGYLLSVSNIDRIVRDNLIPIIADAIATRPASEPAEILSELFSALRPELGAMLAAVEWKLTPFYAVAMDERSPGRVTLTDRYEFAAAHRLHVDELSAEQNREVFGRCNNPSGHGHNYQIEVAVSTALPSNGQPHRFTLDGMQQIVAQTVLDRFDHKHLNLDTSEFANLNPTVENMARTCFTLLESPIEAQGGRLERVTIWETEKTSCTFSREP